MIWFSNKTFQRHLRSNKFATLEFITNLAPLLPVTPPFSDPARSMRLILATRTSADRPASLSFILRKTCSTAWERLLSLLASVACWVRLPFPKLRRERMWSGPVGLCMERPGMEVLLPVSRTCSWAATQTFSNVSTGTGNQIRKTGQLYQMQWNWVYSE